MKKITTALLLCTALTAQAQNIDDAQVMARCSSEFTASASIIGEQSPIFNKLIASAQTSLAISRKMYQNNGVDPSKADKEAKAWIGTLNRQFAKDPAYVRSYLVDQSKGCSQDNAKFQYLAR